MKLLALSLALAATLATTAASASASRTRTLDFCGTARSVARDIVHSTSAANSRSANIKTTYLKIAAAEPALLSSAPGTVKAHLRPVFGFVNLVISDFKKVNWNVAAMGPYTPAILARARSVQGHIPPLKVYFNKTCKLDV